VLDVGGESANLDVYKFEADSIRQRWLYLNISLAKNPDLVADGAHIPLASGAMDTVVCLETLEHVPDPLAVAYELSRVLRAGGFLLLSVPFLGPIHSAPQDFWRFTEYQVKQMMERAGLQIVHMELLGAFFTVLCEMTKQAISNIRPALLRWALGLLFLPIGAALLGLERWMLRGASPLPNTGTFLRSYTTGYVVLAVKTESS
jgi:SAM-dependent methyltransferase